MQRIGQLAGLYQSGDDLSAAQTSNAMINKFSKGIDPAAAIAETPIPQPNREPNEFSYMSIVEPSVDTPDNGATDDSALEEGDLAQSALTSQVDEPESHIDRMSSSVEPLSGEEGQHQHSFQDYQHLMRNYQLKSYQLKIQLLKSYQLKSYQLKI